MTDDDNTPEWRSVPGYPRYQVSSLGEIRGPNGALRPWRTTAGYFAVCLHSSGYGKTHLLHRVVLLAFVGPCPKGLIARHLDGDASNTRLTNLVWGTQSDNMHDKVRHGRCWQRQKTHCKNGHPFSPENTKHHVNGRRECIACRHAAGRRWEQKIAKGTGKGWRSKPVVDLEDGIVYPSATAAALAFDTNRRAIIQVCLGYKGRRTTAGRRFVYA